MAKASQFTLPYKELAELIVKQLDIHEGYWALFFRFGINGTNLSLNKGPYLPTAIIPILEIGITREQELTPLAIDAAAVNPAPKGRKGSRKAKK